MTKKTHETDVEFIRALAQLLRDQDLTEVEVTRTYAENDALSVRVERAGVVVPPPAPVAAPQPLAPPAAPAAAPAAPAADTSGDPAGHPGAITSPMVGTAYLSPEPGASAFVSVGDQVAEGQTLLIIEAMKTMNHIPAPRSGTVKRILVEDASPVEFGAVLMIVE